MGKKLAIKGHLTRREEVIELLEMLSGKDSSAFRCTNPNLIYFVLDNHVHWDYIGPDEIEKYEIFTLEEFFDKYPYKIGDKVIDLKTNKIAEVYKMHWSENTNCVYYDIKYPNNYGCQRRLMDLKPVDDNHTKQSKMKNVLAELLEHIKTTPKEELEREFEEIKEWSNVGPTVEEFMTFCDSVNKPKYPTTYEECKVVMQLQDSIIQAKCGYEYRLISYFQQLLMCRDAYWEIAGKEMRLGKSWKPDWNSSKPKYTIVVIENKLVVHHALSQNYVLAFPTEEMRDAFYKNFAYLIEACKDFL